MTNRKIFIGLVTIAFFYVASPLVFPIAMGAVIAVLFFPLLSRLEKKKVPLQLGSGLLTFGITVLFILPVSFLVFFTVKEVLHQFQSFKAAQVLGGKGAFFDTVVNDPKIQLLTDWVSDLVPFSGDELTATVREWAISIGGRIADLLGEMISHLPGMTMTLIVMVVSIYFCLIDGRRLMFFIRYNSLFSPRQTEQLIQTLGGICRSVILAAVVSGGIQALVEVCACVLTGTQRVGLIGLCVFIASFIPIVGSAPITFFLGLQQLFVEGRQTQGIVLLVVAFLLIGIDNTVRPLFLRGSANLHPLLAFVAAFGGLQTLGFWGVFLGPILAALFVATIQVISDPSLTGE